MKRIERDDALTHIGLLTDSSQSNRVPPSSCWGVRRRQLCLWLLLLVTPRSVPVGPVLEAAACASHAGCIVTVFCDCSFYRKCFCPCVGIFLIALLHISKVLIDPNYLSS